MINSLLVRNFRLFKFLEIRHLERINLVVGKNSMGKSALLEALQLYASTGAPAVMLDLISGRDGNWEIEIAQSDEVPQPLEHPFRSLFHGYHLPGPGEDGIEIGPLDGARLSVRTRFYRVVTEDESVRKVPVEAGEEPGLVDAEMNLEVRENGRLIFLAPAIMDVDELMRFRRRSTTSSSLREPTYSYQVVPSQSVPDSRVAGYWDKIHLTDFDDEVIRALRLVQPKVQGLAFVGDTSDRPVYSRQRRRVPIVRLENSSERLPLKNLGDGIIRTLEVVLALVNARDGLLFVDEVENGIHWTVMPDLWNLIFRLAERLNIQVFATTHSRDCIDGFRSAWASTGISATFHRLDPNLKFGVSAVEYDLPTLGDAIKTEVEVR